MILEFTRKPLRPGITLLVMKGSIHCGPECARLEREVDAIVSSGQNHVIFDMAGVTHVDSAAIGAIVHCLQKLKSAGGGLRIAAPQSMIDHSLKLTRVDKVIEIFPTIDQAAEGLPSTSASKSQA
jgi:anti-sigma B factor antagonist